MRFFILLTFYFYSFSFCDVYNGLIFFSQSQGSGSSKTYLINNSYNKVNIWEHESSAIGIPHINSDGSIIIQFKSPDHSFGNTRGPIGGIFKMIDWSGNTLWEYDFYNNSFHPHHDFEVLPNGNILVLGWEKIAYSDAINAGRVNIENEIWPLVIYEISPLDNNSAEVVWEWHIWDHLIQDVDSSLNNYGIIRNNPELVDINIGQFTNPNEGDWLHTNAIAYNEHHDQIVFSSKHLNEIFIIDHSTTTLEASGHDGGNGNKGGDILYRWGNPINYGRGTSNDQKLSAQHGVHWIPDDLPGAGKLLIFNNNPIDTIPNSNEFGNSSVIEIEPPMDSQGNYFLNSDSVYGPDNYDLVFGGNDTFFSSFQSGAYRLPNGNTFITVSEEKRLFEADEDDEIVWECSTEQVSELIGYTARAKKYSLSYISDLEGDIYIDNAINIYDLIKVSELIMGNQFLEKGDVNGDGEINNEDIFYLINLIF